MFGVKKSWICVMIMILIFASNWSYVKSINTQSDRIICKYITNEIVPIK